MELKWETEILDEGIWKGVEYTIEFTLKVDPQTKQYIADIDIIHEYICDQDGGELNYDLKEESDMDPKLLAEIKDHIFCNYELEE